jgi:hypothetical protein
MVTIFPFGFKRRASAPPKAKCLVVRDVMKQCGDIYEFELRLPLLQIIGGITNDEAAAVAV